MLRRSSAWFCLTAGSKSRLAGREELAAMRAQVSVTEPTKLEAMESFKDVRPRPPNETTETKRKRLIYQSRYRGMVEMDIIFGSFALKKLNDLDDVGLNEYDELLRQYDNDLNNWIVNSAPPPAEISNMSAWKELMSFVNNNRNELLGHRL